MMVISNSFTSKFLIYNPPIKGLYHKTEILDKKTDNKNYATFWRKVNGGVQEIRTPHLFHAMEALYQMS